MTYAHRLQYAGAEPFANERSRVKDADDPLTHRILEQLEQDETYVRLAQVRFLADELEDDLNSADVSDDVWGSVFDAVANTDAPLATAVDAYVDAFIAEFEPAPEAAAENKADDADSERPRRSEPADFGGGESTGVQDLLGGDGA